MNYVIAGIDLHSNNLVIGLIDQNGQRLKHRKLECELKQVLEFFEPLRPRLQSIVVESTFNWYWLVDGLQQEGLRVKLANPAGIEPYNGIKHADDKHDAFYLAELERLGILPQGHIYDAKLRPVRDLLRRRMNLVRQRTALMLSFKSLYARTTGATFQLQRLKALAPEEAKDLYEHPANQLIAQVQVEHMNGLETSLARVEKAVLQSARQLPMYAQLLTMPGVGRILAMTITMEVGDISRFDSPGDFASYCRAVDSCRLSNGKKKGQNNEKCGNKYLSWAFVEAANFAKRYDAQCRRWYDRKAARAGTIIATKALACKLAKAAWHMMKKRAAYDPARMFPESAIEKT
jgi:transposase